MIRLPVDVEGDLHVDLPGGRTIRVAARGTEVVVEVARWRDLAAAWRGLRGTHPVATSAGLLHGADLAGVVRVRGAQVASLGRLPRRRWALRPLGIVRSLLARRA